LQAATSLQSEKKKARLSNEVLWATRCTKLIWRLIEMSADVETPESLFDAVNEIYLMDFPCDTFDDFVLDNEVKKALTDLDIDPADHSKLSDILDPDNGGSITVIELLDGIRRMRGDPRRSDIVTIDLMIRSIQRDVADIRACVQLGKEEMGDIKELVSDRMTQRNRRHPTMRLSRNKKSFC